MATTIVEVGWLNFYMCIKGKFILNFLYACAIVIRSSIEVCTMYKTLIVK